MSTQALSRKWRAQTFDGILGQEHITRTLRNQIRAGRVSHAYLFAGVRGTGKTSTARILAKAVNCIGDTDDPPCDQCRNCRAIAEGTSLDLVEIDAASNRGIDEIRELRERVGLMPQEGRYKVYVIDEVHMLTNEAFNALLKTLEEPPEHVIFVLCTTEAHRLPETILSRCQRFEFRRASPEVLRQKLRYICEQEGLQVADDALAYLARRGAGSFRDAESLLDQVAAYGDGVISLDLVQTVLGAVPYQLVLAISRAVTQGDMAEGMRAIAAAFDSGADARQLVSGIVEQLRTLLLMRVGSVEDMLLVSAEEAAELRALAADPAFSLRRVVQGVRSFSEASEALRAASRPEIPLELALAETVLATAPGPEAVEPVERATSRAQNARRATGEVAALPTSAPEQPAPRQPAVAAEVGSAPPEAVGEVSSASEAPPAGEPARDGAVSVGPTLDQVQGNWARVVARMRAQSPQLQAILRGTYPVAVAEGLVTLACEGPFHRDRLNEDKRRGQVEQVLSEVLGVECRITCVVDREAKARVQGGAEGDASRDLFAAAEKREEQRRELLNHPAVKELTERGGRVRRVQLNDDLGEEE
ncbi:MAG: DNA polymerase III subunit gamma/tau [Anaerolineales bacterium]